MLKRTLTTLVLIPPVVYLIGWSPNWAFLLAVAGAVALGLREYFALCRRMGVRACEWAGYAGGVLVSLAPGMATQGDFMPVSAALLISLLLVSTLALERGPFWADYLGATSLTLFGILYIGLSLACLEFLRNHGQPAEFQGTLAAVPRVAPHPLFFLFVVIWAGDICAYLIGHLVGHTPFFPRISPRKTWEGALGGLAGSLMAAWAYAHWFWAGAGYATAGLVALAGQAGDLVESAIKRAAGQKDSGALLPGHGGFLDRIDSLLFGAPAMWLAVLLLGLHSP